MTTMVGMRMMMGDLSCSTAKMPANKTASLSLASSSSTEESLSSDDSSSFSSYSSSSSFSSSETKLGNIIQSDSGADPAQYNSNGDDDDDDSSFASAYSTSFSFSGSEHTMLRITKSDSLADQLVPCHFAILSGLVNIPCTGGSTMGMFDYENDIIPESSKIDSLLKKIPVFKTNNDKNKDPAANNAETRRVAAAGYKNNHGPTMASTQDQQPLNTVPVRVSITSKTNQQKIKKQTATLLDFFGLNSAVDAAIPAILVSSKRQAPPPPSIYYNNKMSIVGGSNGDVNASPIPVSARSRSSQVLEPDLVQIPISGRTPRCRIPPPIGYGFTLVEEEQPQTLKGDVMPHSLPRLPAEGLPQTDKTPQAHVAAGCSPSATLSPPSSSAAGSPLLSPTAAASSFSDSETQPLLVIESDSVDSNSEKESEPEPVNLSDLASITCMATDALTSWTGDAHVSPANGQPLAMAAPVFAKEVVDVMRIPACPASTTPTEIASVATVPVKQRTMKSVAKTLQKTTPNTTTSTKALLATTVRTPAKRNAKMMAKTLSARKVHQSPMPTKATVPKMTKAKKHTISKVSSPTKARINANRMMKRADLTKGRVPLTTDVNTETLMPKGTPAKPLSAPPVTTKKSTYKLQSRSPKFLVAQE